MAGSAETATKFRHLNAGKIVETADRLAHRVVERFPDSGLAKVAADLAGAARESQSRAATIRRPNLLLRGLVAMFVAALLGPLFFVLLIVGVTTITVWSEPDKLPDSIALVEPAIGTLVFLGAAILFLVTLESRIKRGRALRALHELRSLAHIIDMHQLTKDPEIVQRGGPRTASSPVRSMTAFELNRYFDYCSEMMSVLSKIGALYAQELSDPVALAAVDQIESLTSGFARKIWQKMMVLDHDQDALRQPVRLA